MTPDEYDRARRFLMRRDPILAPIIRHHRDRRLIDTPPVDPFPALVRTIVGQQLCCDESCRHDPPTIAGPSPQWRGDARNPRCTQRRAAPAGGAEPRHWGEGPAIVGGAWRQLLRRELLPDDRANERGKWIDRWRVDQSSIAMVPDDWSENRVAAHEKAPCAV